MAFENSYFIKNNSEFVREFSLENPAPLFRKKFEINNFKKAVLRVCGLGYGYYYINGKKATEDLFVAPVSNFEKTLWYTEYDVTNLLKKGATE